MLPPLGLLDWKSAQFTIGDTDTLELLVSVLCWG